jgi:hypothetical protein
MGVNIEAKYIDRIIFRYENQHKWNIEAEKPATEVVVTLQSSWFAGPQ